MEDRFVDKSRKKNICAYNDAHVPYHGFGFSAMGQDVPYHNLFSLQMKKDATFFY
jgi:hypothetical protein